MCRSGSGLVRLQKQIGTVPLNDALRPLRRLSRPPACWRRCCRRASSLCGEAAEHGGSVTMLSSPAALGAGMQGKQHPYP